MSSCARGFTLIEMLTVMSIVAMLAAMTVPTVRAAMHRARAAQAAEAVASAHLAARRLAIAAPPLATAARAYGVALVAPSDGSRAYATVIYGSSPGDELLVDTDRDGAADRPFARHVLPAGSAFWIATDAQGRDPRPLQGSIAWFYSYRTGQPVQHAADPRDASRPDARAIPIGTAALAGERFWEDTTSPSLYRRFLHRGWPDQPASPVCSHLSVRTAGGSSAGGMRKAVAIYVNGSMAIGDQ